jgi:hypothetical protein
MTRDQPAALESDLFHQFKNHLFVIVSFCDLVLADLSDTDPRRPDILEIRKAADAALALMPELAKQLEGHSAA